jgi:tetratricopeptide (TPR) repeat protein
MLRCARTLVYFSLMLVAVAGMNGNARAAGGGSMGGSMDMPSAMPSAPLTPEEMATADYNAGVKIIKDADEALADAAAATEPKKQQKAQERAKKYFSKAQKKFESAVEHNPYMYQAWNYVGYAKRNLGDYSGALEAYDHALDISPRYFEAIEYRGHAYLGLNRVGDAKQAYLDLFAGNRALADKLLVAMKSWVGTHRSNPQGVDSATVEDFAKWVDERGAIAGNTPGLAPEGSLASWR